MITKSIHLESFTVVGIEVRTNNAREASPEGIISQHWMRFYRDEIAGQIPHKKDDTLYAIYTDYASDHHGDYTFCLGCRVNSVENLPAGLVAKTVPASRYAVFTTPEGAMDQVVIETWRKIWSTTDAELGSRRSYQADFEVYDQRVTDFQHAQLDIFVGVRP